MTESRSPSHILSNPETEFRGSSFSSSCTFSSAFQSIRSFLEDHSLQFRRDSHHVHRLRHKNMIGYLKLQHQNAILTVLRKSISTKIRATQRRFGRNCFLMGRRANSLTNAQENVSKHEQDAGCMKNSTEHIDSERKNDRADESFDDACTTGEMLELFIKAIDNIQRLYRRVRWVRLRDDLIKNSTLPVLTFQSDIASPGRGLVPYSDRLLHAAYLEELIQQCLVKQEYLLSIAEDKKTAAMLGVRLYKLTS